MYNFKCIFYNIFLWQLRFSEVKWQGAGGLRRRIQSLSFLLQFSPHSNGRAGGSVRDHSIQTYYFRDIQATVRKCHHLALKCYLWPSNKHSCFSVIKCIPTNPVLGKQCHEEICSFCPQVSSETETSSWVGRQEHTGKSLPTKISPHSYPFWKHSPALGFESILSSLRVLF